MAKRFLKNPTTGKFLVDSSNRSFYVDDGMLINVNCGISDNSTAYFVLKQNNQIIWSFGDRRPASERDFRYTGHIFIDPTLNLKVEFYKSGELASADGAYGHLDDEYGIHYHSFDFMNSGQVELLPAQYSRLNTMYIVFAD